MAARIMGTLVVCVNCLPDPNLLISPAMIQFWEDHARSYGPTVSGALFGAAWWFFADAFSTAATQIPFVHFLPGVAATIALVMINAIRREELEEQYDAFDEGVFCRARFWLFLSYVVSFSAVIGAIWVLIQGYALNDDAPDTWPGVAGLFQVLLILSAALVFFVARTPADGGGDYGYGSF